MKPQEIKKNTNTETDTNNEMTISTTKNNEKIENENIEKFKEIFDSKYNRQALVIGVGLVVFQQFSGQPSVLYFANRIFEKAGLGYEAALGVGVFKLIMTIVSAGLCFLIIAAFVVVIVVIVVVVIVAVITVVVVIIIIMIMIIIITIVVIVIIAAVFVVFVNILINVIDIVAVVIIDKSKYCSSHVQ